MVLFAKIIAIIMIASFLVPSYTRMNHLRSKGYYKLASALEGFIMILAIICQWSWYIGFGLVGFYIIKAIF
jgi:hypothetical protein